MKLIEHGSPKAKYQTEKREPKTRAETVFGVENEGDKMIDLLRSTLSEARIYAERFLKKESNDEDIGKLGKIMGKLHSDKFGTVPLQEETRQDLHQAYILIGHLRSALKGEKKYWTDRATDENLLEKIQKLLDKHDPEIQKSIEESKKLKKQSEIAAKHQETEQLAHKQLESDVSKAEDIRQSIRGNARQKPIKPQKKVIFNEPPIELGDEDIEYVDPKEEQKRKMRVLQNKEAKIKDQITEIKKKISLGDRWRQAKQMFTGGPAIGPFYRINVLKSDLEDVQRELGFLEEDQHMKKLQREAQAEFKTEKPSFIKSGKQVFRDLGRDAVSTFIPGIDSHQDRETHQADEEHGTRIEPSDFTDIDEFEASLERDPKAAEQQRKDAQKANRDRLKAKTEARHLTQPEQNSNQSGYTEAQAEVKTEKPSFIKSGKQVFRDLGRDAVSTFIPGIDSHQDRETHRADEEHGTRIEPSDFTDIDEFEASIELDPKVREKVHQDKENRYKKLFGERASEIIGTIDNLFDQMSSAEIKRLGFSRNEYLDYAAGLMQNSTDQWKDEKSGYSSDDYFKLAQSKILEFNKKLGLPPNFITNFGASRLQRSSAIGNNEALLEMSKTARKITGIPEGVTRGNEKRILTGKPKTSDSSHVEKTTDDLEVDVDLSDLEKDPLESKFDQMVEDSSEILGKEKANKIWNLINQALSEKKTLIQSMNNYDYLTYRGNADYIQRLSPNVKTKSLETSLVFAITDLVKGTLDHQLEGKVMSTLNTLGISRENISDILYPPDSSTKPENGIAAEKRGTKRNISERNKRENARKYGGLTPSGM
ncbi:hypothetical protein IT408_01115 [Candidatus Uhrbacteria bacterium]|nr:hypothetical protein [Candidatus Uhrbacteria bacterium]